MIYICAVNYCEITVKDFTVFTQHALEIDTVSPARYKAGKMIDRVILNAYFNNPSHRLILYSVTFTMFLWSKSKKNMKCKN